MATGWRQKINIVAEMSNSGAPNLNFTQGTGKAMNDPINLPAAAPAPRGAGAWTRRLLVGAAFAATFAAGALVSTVAPAAAVAVGQAGMGMAMGKDHAAMHAMMQAHIDRMLVSVGATADQTSRIRAIFASAMGTMGSMHAKMAASHAQLHQLLTAPTIDRAALETLRAQQMAQFDQASKVLVGALADAAGVLTPDQRARLGAEMAKHPHPAMGAMPGM